MSLYGGPAIPPAKGREWYLPEVYWVEDGFPFREAFRATAAHLVQWATHFVAHRSVYPGDPRTGKPRRMTTDNVPRETRAGELPIHNGAREALVHNLLDWLEGRDGAHVIFRDFALTTDDEHLLSADGDVGIPGALQLTPDQFASVQDAWRARGLPEDLYFPAAEQRMMLQPNPDNSDDIEAIQPRYFSPRLWQRRAATGSDIPKF